MTQTFLLWAAEGYLIWRTRMLNLGSQMKLALIINIFAFEQFTCLLEGKTMSRSGGKRWYFHGKSTDSCCPRLVVDAM